MRLTLRPSSVDERLDAGHVCLPMTRQTPITVVIAHFDDVFAGGLRELIERDPSLVIVASDVEHRRIGVVLRGHRPDVAILALGALSAYADVRELSARHPETRLVLLGGAPTRIECVELLAAGASACLDAGTQSRDVINAIHLASRGLQVLPRGVAGSHDGPSPVAGIGRLSRRESEVLPLLQLGHSNAQIALALHVGIETVRTHARNIYRKLGVSSRRDLAPPPMLDPEPARPEHRPLRRTATPSRRPRRGHGTRHS